MSSSELRQLLIRNYFIIFTVIILGTAVLNPIHAFAYHEIMLVAAFSLAGDLTACVLYSRKELTKSEQKMRNLLHLVLLEVVILTFGNITDQVEGVGQNILFALEIIGIFALVSFITWLMDYNTAKKINQQLNHMKTNK